MIDNLNLAIIGYKTGVLPAQQRTYFHPVLPVLPDHKMHYELLLAT